MRSTKTRPMPAGAVEGDEQRDVLGELEDHCTTDDHRRRDKEEARMTRADRSLIRQCILDAAQRCAAEKRTVLTCDVRDALRERARDATLPEMRRARLLEMADAMEMFCQGVDGEMFDRPARRGPEADITIVDLATFAREGLQRPTLDLPTSRSSTRSTTSPSATSSWAGRSST